MAKYRLSRISQNVRSKCIPPSIWPYFVHSVLRFVHRVGLFSITMTHFKKERCKDKSSPGKLMLPSEQSEM